MARFFAQHLAFLLLTLFVVSFLVFALNEFSPGAVARKELGAYATQEQVDLLTRQLGLDRPLPVRYAEYLGKAAIGDLGYSARFKLPVKDVIGVDSRGALHTDREDYLDGSAPPIGHILDVPKGERHVSK